jgi:exodeoxyribonuclease V alpha subunit
MEKNKLFTFTVRVVATIYQKSDYIVLSCEFPPGTAPGFAVRSTGYVVGQYSGRVKENDVLEVTGEYAEHPKYGEEFAAVSILPSLDKFQDSGDAAFLRFMLEGRSPHIYPEIISRIVVTYGQDAVKTINQTPQVLEKFQTEYFGQQEREEFLKSWNYLEANRTLVYLLTGHGIDPYVSRRINHYFGSCAMEVLKTAPYSLINKPCELDFHTADVIALRVGFNKFNPVRFQYAVNAILEEGLKKNLISFTKKELSDQLKTVLGISEETATDYLEQNLKKCADLIEVDDRIYVKRLYDCEQIVQNKIAERLAAPVATADVTPNFAWIDAKLRTKTKPLTEQQQTAVRMALTSNIVLFEGGDKSGKTKMVRAITEQFRYLQKNVVKTTCHHLEMQVSDTRLKRFQTADVIIVEDLEYMTLPCFASLLNAVENQQVVLVADAVHQVRACPGNVLNDLLADANLPKLRLLPENAMRAEVYVRYGRDPFALLESDRCHVIEQKDEESTADKIYELATKTIPEVVDAFSEVDIVTSCTEGFCGTEKLNRRFSDSHSDSWEIPFISTKKFKISDRVLVTRDAPRRNVVMGEVGVITDFDRFSKRLTVHFPVEGLNERKEAQFGADEADMLELAYAVAIPRAVQKEHSIVIMPITEETAVHLCRDSILSVCAKTKDHIYFVGQKRLIEKIIHSEDH